VHKVSIIPRGIGALGYTIQRPTEDRFLMTQEELENKMAVLLGGRAAERLVFGTGYPHAEPMPAITQLMYAQISDEQRALIGSGNLERLIAGVTR
jgi:ATP-dependent Zn protease